MAERHQREEGDPAVELFDRWLAHRGDGVEESDEQESDPARAVVAALAEERVPCAPVPAPAPARVLSPARHTTSGDIVFAPRTGVRRLVGLVVLLALGATAGAAYLAATETSTLTVGVSVTLGVLTLLLWGIRVGSPITHLEIKGGQLVAVRAGSRTVFDLASRHTPVEVVGSPGDRTWKVLFRRPALDPFVVDSSMVDPHEFTEAVLHYRPAASHQ